MTADILMIIIGLILVFASYVISEKIEKKPQKERNSSIETTSIQMEEIEKLKEEIINTLEDKKVNKMIEAEEELGHISNEKIMAFDEFSKQVLEKMEANHKEVVFLYNMLNDKEEEIKKVITETDQSKVVIEELILKMHEETKQVQEKISELEKSAKKFMEIKESVPVLVEKVGETTKEENIENLKQEEFVVDIKEVDDMIEAMSEEEKDMLLGELEIEEQEDNNDRERILDLHGKGKSIVEISRELGKGQGEVKLVIDLFQGGKKKK